MLGMTGADPGSTGRRRCARAFKLMEASEMGLGIGQKTSAYLRKLRFPSLDFEQLYPELFL